MRGEPFGEKEREESWRAAKGALGGSRGEFMPASMYRVEAAADCSEGEWELTDDVREWLRGESWTLSDMAGEKQSAYAGLYSI